MSVSLRTELGDPPGSLRAGLSSVGVTTARELPPATSIHRAWLADGGPFGLGMPQGPVHIGGPGGMVARRGYAWGDIVLADRDPVVFTENRVTVRLAALACHHTDDPSGTDEPYVIATLAVVDSSPNPQVITRVFGPGSATPARGRPAVLLKNQMIGEVGARGAGALVHLAVFDSESGNHEEVRRDVEEYMKEAVKAGGVAIAGMVGAGDINTAASVAGDILNSKIGRGITAGLSRLIAGLFSDDLIGEKSYIVTATDVAELATPAGLKRRLRRRPDLDPDVEFTHPVEHDHPAWQIGVGDGQGEYRAYLMVNASQPPTPF